MKKSLFSQAQVCLDKRNANETTINGATVAYEEYLERKIQSLKKKNKLQQPFVITKRKVVAIEGMFGTLFNKDNDKKNTPPEDDDSEDWGVINVIMKQRDGLKAAKQKNNASQTTIAFTNCPLATFKNLNDFLQFFKWYQSILEYLPKYYQTLLDCHQQLLPLATQYTQSPNDETLVKGYIAVVRRMKTIDKVKALGFKHHQDEDHEYGTDSDINQSYSDKDTLYHLTYRTKTNDEGYKYDLIMPNITGFSEWDYQANTKLELQLSDTEYEKFLDAAIDLMDIADKVFEDVFENNIREMVFLGEKFENINEQGRQKNSKGSGFDQYKIDGISSSLMEGEYTDFFFEVFAELASCGNKVLKAVS